ncbi:MAG: phosphate signaling complex protein PhoU [Ignavibacteriaceae bacterium]|nr:phosphate signaling complex protein PhoU [Ignavibacteriaceae bacterium]
MERHLDLQLEKLRTRIIKMCSLVDEQVEYAFRAVQEHNKELAQLVIDRDRKVDKYDLKIDKICQKIFALSQPVAMDLRLIMSSLTINTNLERIGDIAVNISEAVLRFDNKAPFFERLKFGVMAEHVKEMIKNAIDSFIENNAKLAEKVVKLDDKVDELNKEHHGILIEIMKESPANIEQAVAMLVIIRHLERLGDHATNIAEDVYFIVEAQLLKHNYEKLLLNQIRDNEDKDDSDES